MNNQSGLVRLLYETFTGNILLKAIMKTRMDRIAVLYLNSRFSKPWISLYARKHGIELGAYDQTEWKSFGDFFIREGTPYSVDCEPSHLISPCDGWLSAYDIQEGVSLEIKGSQYAVADIINDSGIADNYKDGLCLVFRLCASDIHHYCYIDDAVQGENHYIPGELHSVQPSALGRYHVIALNRRSWCELDTDHFGSVIQAEIGAMVVGGIVNYHANTRVSRGEEKGRFELAGSTIVLFFEHDSIRLLPEYANTNCDNEIRVRRGQVIGYRSGLKH